MSLRLVGCGKKRQHRLVPKLHLGNCAREKKFASAPPRRYMHVQLLAFIYFLKNVRLVKQNCVLIPFRMGRVSGANA